MLKSSMANVEVLELKIIIFNCQLSHAMLWIIEQRLVINNQMLLVLYNIHFSSNGKTLCFKG